MGGWNHNIEATVLPVDPFLDAASVLPVIHPSNVSVRVGAGWDGRHSTSRTYRALTAAICVMGCQRKLLKIMVRPAGFEPATFGSGAQSAAYSLFASIVG